MEREKTISVTFLNPKGENQSQQDKDILEATAGNAEKASQELSGFYKITLYNPPPIYIGTREEIDKKTGKQTESWIVGMRSRYGLFLLDPRLYKNTAPQYGLTPQTEHYFSEVRYSKTVKHELGHEYFQAIFKLPYNVLSATKGLPSLDEGLQFYLAGQLREDPSVFKNFKADSLSPGSEGFYENSAMVVRRLMEIYRPDVFMEKLTGLLNDLRNFYNSDVDKGKPISEQMTSAFNKYYEKAFGLAPINENLEHLVKTGTLPDES